MTKEIFPPFLDNTKWTLGKEKALSISQHFFFSFINCLYKSSYCLYFISSDIWDSSTMKQAGRTVKKKLLHGLSVTSEQEITQWHLREKNHCSLVKPCCKLRQSRGCDFQVCCLLLFVWVCQQPADEIWLSISIHSLVNWKNFGSWGPRGPIGHRSWLRKGTCFIIFANFVLQGLWWSPKVVKFTLQTL